jgi:ATP-dependent helicase HepA
MMFLNSNAAAQLGTVFVNGLIVQHRTYGYGKVIETTGTGARVQFCGSGQAVTFGFRAFQNKDLQHARLLVETPVRGPRGLCVVNAVPDPHTAADSVFIYGVEYEEGLTDKVSELELTPLVTIDRTTPVGQLCSFAPHSLSKLIAREKFVDSLALLANQASGLRALLASRIELHPHQAFVAGTIVLDPQRRYILADEVGLGKTIEAGVVIHDRLMQRPESRILILTPGTLSRQWLCELHTSFGGQDFRLLDLHPPEVTRAANWPRVICSTGLALQSLATWIDSQPWDMVVIDEAHHLLSSPSLYSLATALSTRVHDLLLLSALPARSREHEFLQLLRLLEPRRYQDGLPTTDRFAELYASQATIGRRLIRLANDVRDYRLGEAATADVIDMIDNLLAVPVLSEDADLREAAARAHADPSVAAEIGNGIGADVLDRYRINRRILRNRRAKLVDQQLLTVVRRVVHVHPFVPTQLEVEVHDACQALLEGAQGNRCPPGILRPLARSIYGALAAPDLLLALLRNLQQAQPRNLTEKAVEFINLAGGASYESWTLTEDVICTGARRYLDLDTLDVTIDRTRRWADSAPMATRLQSLLELLDEKRGKREKIIVFAGLKGFADATADALEARYGEREVARFTHTLDDAEKEDNVRAFRQDKARWLLVCDETGGEGRNFQFVAAIVHLDLPWAVSTIEQRIGRLDRIGRTDDVISHVICNGASIEAAWCDCLQEGFAVFIHSISGVEFGLRQQQDRALDAAVAGIDALAGLIPSISADAAQERASDDTNALLDDASGRGLSASSFGHHATPDIDHHVEDGFLEFFRAVASKGSARRGNDARTPQGLWCLRPDEIRNITIVGLERDDGGLLAEHLGTFDRAIARNRRDVEFFCFGNRLFDAVTAIAMTRPVGRSFAVTIAGTGRGPAAFFEIQAFATPDLSGIAQDAGLLNRARLVIDRRRVSMLLNVATLEPVSDAEGLRNLANVRAGRHPAKDLAPAQIAEFATSLGIDWGTQVKEAVSLALRRARSRFDVRLCTDVANELKLISDQRRRIVKTDGAECEEIGRLDALTQSLERWDVHLDTVGLISLS